MLVACFLLEVDEIDHKHGGEERGALSGIGLFGEHDVEIVRVGVQRSTTSLPAAFDHADLRAVGVSDLKLDNLTRLARTLAEKPCLCAVAARVDVVTDFAVSSSDVQDGLAAREGVEHFAEGIASGILDVQ